MRWGWPSPLDSIRFLNPFHPRKTNAESSLLRSLILMNEETTNDKDEMRDHYDFSQGGVRGKYYEAAIRAKGLAKIDADLLEFFPSSAEINQALRTLVQQNTPKSSVPKGV
jgi:hypothetical protein